MSERASRSASIEKAPGRVYLVGAGPGDPGLLTLRGRDLIAASDCVIYDYLVNPALLAHARPGAQLIDVGKRGAGESWAQVEINRLLIAKAREHSCVVRLKGGDPFIFGRGGEEAAALVEAGIPWEAVPGVSAGSAVAAYAGIPVTHRSLSSSVAFVTGHEDPAKGRSSICWEHLARGVETLVFFMGVANLDSIAAQLVAHGRSPQTPVAVIRWGTYAHQETWVADLDSIAALIAREGVTAPALIVIGEVVRLREQLQWFAPDQIAPRAEVA
jgi:uroporphyrinogen III methyltransferase/synthase